MSTKAQQAEAAKEKGNSAFGKESCALALTAYTEAISLVPDNAVFYSNRSATYLKLKQYTQALNDAERAAELKPDCELGPNWALDNRPGTQTKTAPTSDTSSTSQTP